ncbi:hypothetical protein FQR65_LT15285 [Abscondita terminalis]|nr:hypothetical protein FQR65_LT15285 [Abscondita terminalis]
MKPIQLAAAYLLQKHDWLKSYPTPPVVVCSFGDNSITEGEVSEAFQFAALHQLPIIFLVQDNNWGISVTAEEARSQDAYDFITGFKGIERMRIDGTEFPESYLAMKNAFDYVRNRKKTNFSLCQNCSDWSPYSGVRKEMYRPLDD